MKKSLIALATLGAFAGAASAQSSVTLFGVVDASLTYVKNGNANMKSMSNSGLAASRLGFRGEEDLGGGLKAGFWLEMGLGNDAGTAGSGNMLFNRRSTLSLMGGFGEVRLGRDLLPTWTGYADYDAFGTNGIGGADRLHQLYRSGSWYETVGGPAGVDIVRSSNMISYFLPNMGGLYGQVSVAAGEGSTTGNKYYGGRLGYKAGPLDVSLALGQHYDIAGTTDVDLRIYTLGASYDFGGFKLNGMLSQNKVSDGGAKERHITIGGSVPMGAGLFRASYTNVNGDGKADANQFALGYVHNLSKRTALYGTLAIIKNKDEAAYTVANAPAGNMMDGGKRSSGAEVGIRHSF